MQLASYAVLIGLGLLLAIGGFWQGRRPDYVTRKRQEIAEQMGLPGAGHTRFSTQLGGYLVAVGGVAVVVSGSLLLAQALTATR